MQQDLEVDRVTKRYGAHTAVDALSLAIAHGSFFSILGPSGCGKTTLLRIVAGFLAPDDGDVRIGGRSMRGVAPNRRTVSAPAARAIAPRVASADMARLSRPISAESADRAGCVRAPA